MLELHVCEIFQNFIYSLTSLLVYPVLLHKILGEIMLWDIGEKRNYYFTLKWNECAMEN